MAQHDEPSTPSTMASTNKTTSPGSHSTVSSAASRKRRSDTKTKINRSKRQNSNQTVNETTSRKLLLPTNEHTKPTKTDPLDKPDATNVEWLNPTFVLDLVNKLDPDGEGEEDYEENINALLQFYKPQEIGLALLRTKMLLGDTNPQVPKLRKEREQELIDICINNFNMNVGQQKVGETQNGDVPEVIDLSNDDESR